MSSSGKGKKTTENDDVEHLLREAQDDVLLRLSVDAHMSRGSAARFIDPDLERRFQALKSIPKTTINNNPTPSIPQKPPPTVSIAIDQQEENGDGNNLKVDDLFSRFAALKGSLPSYGSSSSLIASTPQQHAELGNKENSDGEEDEVEKVIKWAIDAARLDPSPPSDTDDECNGGEDYSDHSDSDDDDRRIDVQKKGRKK